MSALKSIAARKMGFKVELMQWHNKMDLIALATAKGSIIVQRLNWQRICTFPPPVDSQKVACMSWRPDEKLLAVGYANGTLILLDIETQEAVHKLDLGHEIVSMHWTENSKEESDSSTKTMEHETFLPPFQNLSSLSSQAKKTDYNNMKTYSNNILNFLVCSLKSKEVVIFAYGILLCGRFPIQLEDPVINNELELVQATLSSDFKHLYVFIRTKKNLRLLTYENNILSKYSLQLLRLAVKHGQIVNTLSYIDEVLQCIKEAWESVLLEMDNKLTKYANSQPAGAVSVDFLELLMFGEASDSLEKFLTVDLTEKGLKKLGHSIDVSYKTILKLVVRHLNKAALHICYHLTALKGMAKNVFDYEALLGSYSNTALENAGSLFLKITELQQTIEKSSRDYKVFWVWLYINLLRLLNETVPTEIGYIDSQEINHLAEFLYNFDNTEMSSDGRKRFNLERVGQYLENKNLDNPPSKDEIQTWTTLLEQNACLLAHETIYKHRKETSLVQEIEILKQSINEIFEKPQSFITKDIRLTSTIEISQLESDEAIAISHICADEGLSNQFAGIIGDSLLFYLDFHAERPLFKICRTSFKRMPCYEESFRAYSNIRFRCVQLYNEDVLSILLDVKHLDEEKSCFLQQTISSLRQKSMQFVKHNDVSQLASMPIMNAYEILDAEVIRNIDDKDCIQLSVSGQRKVASILSEGQKKIRIYETEAEDDLDDDQDLSQDASIDISKDSYT